MGFGCFFVNVNSSVSISKINEIHLTGEFFTVKSALSDKMFREENCAQNEEILN